MPGGGFGIQTVPERKRGHISTDVCTAAAHIWNRPCANKGQTSSQSVLTKVKAKGSQGPLLPPVRTQHEMGMLLNAGDDRADGEQRLKVRVFQPQVLPLEGDWEGENQLHF